MFHVTEFARRHGTFDEFRRIMAELNPDSIRKEAEQAFRIVVLGRPNAGKSTLIRALRNGAESPPGSAGALIEVDLTAGEMPDHPPAVLYLYVVSAATGILDNDRVHLAALRHLGCQVVVAVTHADHAVDRDAFERGISSDLADLSPDGVAFGNATSREDAAGVFGTAILRSLPEELHLAAARRLAALREPVGNALIAKTARVNCEYAVASNLPAFLPILGILGSASDFIVLTKNQAMLIFKLAALYDRNLGDKLAVLAEIAPVVGAAFFWRSIARSLVGLLPPVVAAGPKATIAFAGTYVVGKIAQRYYATGLVPNREEIERFTRDAYVAVKGMVDRLPPHGARVLGRIKAGRERLFGGEKAVERQGDADLPYVPKKD